MAKSVEDRRKYAKEYYHKNKKKKTYKLERDTTTGQYYNPNPIDFDIKEIIDLYISKEMSTGKIGKKYNVDKTLIRRILVDNNIKLRTKEEVRPLNSNSRSTRWKGYGEIRGCYFNVVKRGAKQRNFEFSISIEDIWNLFLKQNRKCALSGVELFFGQNDKAHKSGITTASLDRIDSNKGYTIDNIQWVHKWINLMKQDMHDVEFIDWCKLVTNYNNGE